MTKPPPIPHKKKSRAGKILLVFFGGIFALIAIARMSEPESPTQTAEASPTGSQPATSEPQAVAETPEDASLTLEAIAKARGSWPKQVIASVPLEIEDEITIPAGAPLNVEDISSDGIVTVRTMGKRVEIDQAETDLVERATAIREENRRQAEAIIQAEVASAEKERQELLTVIGPEPRQDSWTGGTVSVKRYLKANLKDPDSLEYLEWTAPRVTRLDGEPYWHVRVRYRAKNSFGGYVIENQNFYLRNDTVLLVQ